MASVSMAASFLGGATVTHRRAVITNSVSPKTVHVRCEKKGEAESSNGRREVVFAAITATICSVAGMAVAEEQEPKRGTPEAKKAYGPVCVANPTARICHY